ncbi:MAG: insulinase family protein [Clostridia bacterium]|nr:insulinase family protein [Clostridia bacterium]
MTCQENDRILGFRVTRVRPSAELHGRLVEFRHEKTGASLCWLDNGAENKVFSIAFRTLPTDNTGVFHILEHSVLCGSEKYPVKEPFVELLKGSMNTFLNAMTFPDMTMYPVASRNDQDLMNLTEVYLDAVFRPRILQDERLFRQEGWHIEQDEAGQYLYKGVVFNEMKGAMSDVQQVGETEMARQLFPDTGYGFNSGGDPEDIPSLTYAQYLETYRRHYHPSNAWIYLDGAVPMDRMLPLLAEYLDNYEAETDLPVFTLQKPVSSDRTVYYELGQDEDAKNKGHLYLSRLFGTWETRERNMAVSILADVLTGSNEAPLKRDILEKGLAQDFSLSIDDSALQSVVTLHAENLRDGQEQALMETLDAFAAKLEREGLDPAAVEASLNRFAFTLKEEDEPQGIDRAVRIMGSWLYDGDPLLSLENDAALAALRQMHASGELNALALSLLRDRTGLCTLRLLPSQTLGEEKRRQEEARLAATVAAWSPADRAANEALIASLRAWQEAPDSPEALATLPMLTLADADLPPVWPETQILSVEDVPVLLHPISCGGIVHLRAFFSLTDFTVPELQDVSLLCALLGKLPTARYDALTLQQEIKRITGRLGFSVTTRTDPGDASRCIPTLVAFTSVLKENVPQALSLLVEILKHTDFSSTEKIQEIVLQLELMSRQRIVNAGHVIGIRSVLSHYSADQALRNALEGDQGVRYLHAFALSPAEKLPGLLATAEKLRSLATVRRRLTLSVTMDAPSSEAAGSGLDWEPFLSALPEGKECPFSARFAADSALRQGYRIPAQVGFAVRGWRLSEMDESFRGPLFLAANILTYSYLWVRIRVQGGAYGCGFQADRYGNLYSYSYRDPTPARTLQADQDASAFLREFLSGGESLDKFIISTLNDLNPLLSPREKGALADGRYFSGYTREEAEAIRKSILHATPEDLLALLPVLDAFAEHGAVCVVAPGDSLDACPDLPQADL